MNPILRHLRAMPRRELLNEVRRCADDPDILLWEQVGYGDMYKPVRANPQAAARLGVALGDVIGYKLLVDRPMGSALGDLMNVVRQDDPPYKDPFRQC